MTGQDADAGRLGLLGRTRAEAFTIRVVVLQPGSERVFDEREWRDSLVEVECGQLELELRNGQKRVFSCGDVLWLVGLPILSLHNHGCERVVLVAASRRDEGARARA
jgi:quercetin dioxygenase-like cupin family protein